MNTIDGALYRGVKSSPIYRYPISYSKITNRFTMLKGWGRGICKLNFEIMYVIKYFNKEVMRLYNTWSSFLGASKAVQYIRKKQSNISISYLKLRDRFIILKG